MDTFKLLFTKQHFLVVSIILVCIVGLIVGTNTVIYKRDRCPDCHVIVFDADILRNDVIDCVNKPEVTPNLCNFKNEFIIFNNHHAQTDLTRPGMASFLTATYPSTHGIWIESLLLDTTQPTLPMLLKNKGYETIITGAANAPTQVITEPFDKSIKENVSGEALADLITKQKKFIYIYSGALHYPYLTNTPTPITLPSKTIVHDKTSYYKEIDILFFQKYPELKEAPIIKEYLDKNQTSEGISEYFFTVCWESELEIKKQNFPGCWQIYRSLFTTYAQQKGINNPETIRALYMLKVHEVDMHIGEVVNELKQRNIWDKTLFVLRSDHGEEFFEHGDYSHNNNLYQEIIRVPFWIRIPHVKGYEYTHLSKTIDETPTILSALGLTPDPLMQGKNLFKDQKKYLIAQKHFGHIYAIRDASHKLIVINNPTTDTTQRELYNVITDPHEQDNIIHTHENIQKKLETEYFNIVNFMPQFQPVDTFTHNLTEEEKLRIFKNGYF